jgi:uncharacterized OB-fold protein
MTVTHWRAEIDGRYEPFWAGIDEHRIRLPKCAHCTRFHWYPESRCPHCGSDDLSWCPVRPRGRIYAATVVRRALVKDVGPRPPFGVALVELDDAPACRLVLNIDVTEAPDIDAEVDIVFRTGADGHHLPYARIRQSTNTRTPEPDTREGVDP